ncbi:hypothetical protein NEOLI_005217 [Neolecta irregularis DAH-3]|uniref:Uncharacterized protein n=1 Tax=Neolecta irregularis (strain DAH-3) TaxID=1198029 RepID=A0A1U7LJZ0_NEOID|nr:hypothetical protein NEOLI_005217 [Neolecta irregularis DAH-3]|eukprot:OLL22975.1 hypothetical protein NEOLI_005217 [Neolecta irregularis DAH-3]
MKFATSLVAFAAISQGVSFILTIDGYATYIDNNMLKSDDTDNHEVFDFNFYNSHLHYKNDAACIKSSGLIGFGTKGCGTQKATSFSKIFTYLNSDSGSDFAVCNNVVQVSGKGCGSPATKITIAS